MKKTTLNFFFTCIQVAAAINPNKIPYCNQKNKFTTIKLLGKGTHGTVSLVQHPDYESPVALKECKDKCEGEIGILAFLSNKGITSDILCHFPNDKSFIMKYFEGITLQQVDDKPQDFINVGLTPNMLHELFKQMLHSLAALHSFGIRNPDAHLGNWLWNEQTHIVQLIDFGNAKMGLPRGLAHDHSAVIDWKYFAFYIKHLFEECQFALWKDSQSHTSAIEKVHEWINKLENSPFKVVHDELQAQKPSQSTFTSSQTKGKGSCSNALNNFAKYAKSLNSAF